MAKIPLLQYAMGEKFEQLKGPVKTHFSLTPDDEASIILQGHMEQVWHPGWLTGPMWVGSLLGVLFPETGQNVPTYITIQAQGLRQRWDRTFEFARRQRTFSDVMVLDQAKNRILNFFGANDRFAMVFHFLPLANGGLEIIGGQQYLNFGRIRLSVPRMLTPALITQEWPIGEDRIAMELRIHHPLVGQIYSYRGQLTVTKRGA